MTASRTYTTAPSDVFDITGGPGAGELWDAAKYAYSRDHKFVVRFVGVRSRPLHATALAMKMRIIGISHEDGSGHNFILTVQITDNGDVVAWDDPAYQGTKTLYYNAKTREGRMDLRP